MTTKLQSIQLQGFRAYLARQQFNLRPGKSLAVFAPNAKGKSSLVDAIEVFFSATGSLKKLGERKSGTQAGPEALEHVHAKAKKIEPSIRLDFRTPPAAEVGEERRVTRPPAGIPKVASDILKDCKHDFIVRGHELRAFVEAQTPEDRYQEVSRWFGLTPLVTAQKNLRALRRRVTELSSDRRVLDARLVDIANATGGVVTSNVEADVVRWINSALLGVLDKSLHLATLSESDGGYIETTQRARAEADTLGLTALDQLVLALADVSCDADGVSQGRTDNVAKAVAGLKAASDAELAERTAAEKSVFAKAWDEAQKVFANEKIVLDICPVCETPLDETHLQSRDGISARLAENLKALAAYNTASVARKTAERGVQQAHSLLKTANKTLESLLKAGKFDAELRKLSTYFAEVEDWKSGDALPVDGSVKVVIQGLAKSVSESAASIRARQGDGTFAGAVGKIDEMRRIVSGIRLAQLELDELVKMSVVLENSALRIDKEITSYVASLLDGLRDEINRVYAKIQGPSGGAPRIGLEPPDPEARGQLKLDLVIDFAANRKGVNPAGYLSDSQIHTMALSLRLAAIKLFNTSFPFVVLDDIVTSYDADHRKALASVMAEEFSAFQFIVVTHDERFFRYMKEHMPAGEWIFRQITEIERDYGPKYVDHRIADEVIEAKLLKGEHTANEIRQAEEEWLLGKAREFGVNVRIRDVDKPYTYERSEIASALASFLKERKIRTPTLPGFSNPLWASLQAGEVENFGSHFQDNPQAAGSSGDERKRWTEFKEFRDLFRCACGHTRFKRPRAGVEYPLCSKCETPFAFSDSKSETLSDAGTVVSPPAGT